ncbi:Hypothetical predicted protein [Mytilus galloprovincialis]|uniref:Uncharacterized protein n=1 Tax=Mytilus galloprovincialis TaxID=29158 RepID=A0A8B6CEY0_MYTGA|nr:Hypothetical predicted protein [Mytilus galloprovincialis]
MSGRGKGVRRKTRSSPYETQWDSNNPSNWTINKLKEELNKKGIRTPSGMSKQVLKQLYLENCFDGVTSLETQQTDTVSDEINTDSSPESTLPITLAESVHQHRSSVSNGENENGGTDRNIAQCFEGLQETFKQLIYRDNCTHDTANGLELNISGKPDPRLNRKLTIQEFIKAFGKFKRVMSSVYPDRRAELDAYEDEIIDISNFYGDRFYDYHKLFSAKSAALLRERRIKVDWSKRDRDLLSLIVAGGNVNVCKICNLVDHTTAFCPMQTSMTYQDYPDKVSRQVDTTDKLGRKKIYHSGREVCNNFNTSRGCTRSFCHFSHICSRCKVAGHTLLSCQKVFPSQGRTEVQSKPHTVNSSQKFEKITTNKQGQ